MFGRSPLRAAAAALAPILCAAARAEAGETVVKGEVGATRYARPWRPVNPFEMICEESARSDRHLAHRRRDVEPDRKLGAGGDEASPSLGGDEEGEAARTPELVLLEDEDLRLNFSGEVR